MSNILWTDGRETPSSFATSFEATAASIRERDRIAKRQRICVAVNVIGPSCGIKAQSVDKARTKGKKQAGKERQKTRFGPPDLRSAIQQIAAPLFFVGKRNLSTNRRMRAARPASPDFSPNGDNLWNNGSIRRNSRLYGLSCPEGFSRESGRPTAIQLHRRSKLPSYTLLPGYASILTFCVNREFWYLFLRTTK